MNPSNKNHLEGRMVYFYSKSLQPIHLVTEEIAIMNGFLVRLYADLGSINWIKMAFTTSLDAYWKTKGATMEVAKEYEEGIGPQMQRVVIARQFTRASLDTVKNHIVENMVDTVSYWNASTDPYPPSNIEDMKEPFRSFFLLVKDLVGEMEQRNNPSTATEFLASLMAAFALTYPTNYLAADPYFQRYLKNEVINEAIDDDYTFYLCRDMNYMLFDRF